MREMNDIRQQILEQTSASLARQKDNLIKEALDNLLGDWTMEQLLGKLQSYKYKGDPNEYLHYENTLIGVFGPWEFEEDKVTFKYWRYG